MIDFTNETNGDGSFSQASLSYPTGNETLTDPTLYSYIKTLYDNGITKTIINYTKTGSFTITDNGYASGFANNECINTKTAFKPQGTWELSANIILPDDVTGMSGLFGSTNAGVLSIGVNANGSIRASLSTNTASWNIGEFTSNAGDIPYNVETKVSCKFTGTEYQLLVNNTVVQTLTSSAKIGSYITELLVGNTYNTLAAPMKGTININSIVIKMDDTIIYHCKHIPCKQLSTGAMVISSNNTSIVQTIYNATGSALYYVIDTTNETVRLPIGDIFGFITQAMEQPAN